MGRGVKKKEKKVPNIGFVFRWRRRRGIEAIEDHNGRQKNQERHANPNPGARQRLAPLRHGHRLKDWKILVQEHNKKKKNHTRAPRAPCCYWP
jgi:hypothetical protein